MRLQRGFSFFEFIIVALIVGLLFAIIVSSYQTAVLVERREIAKQSLLTVVGLQERWFVRMYEYARSIDDVGGADVAGDQFKFHITQDPCGNTSCFTVTAIARGEQEEDRECEKMSISNMGVKRAYNRSNQDTTMTCWNNET